MLKQKAEKNSDIPLSTASSKVLINLKTHEVNLQGSDAAPVCTVIELGGIMKKLTTKKMIESKPLNLAYNNSFAKKSKSSIGSHQSVIKAA